MLVLQIADFANLQCSTKKIIIQLSNIVQKTAIPLVVVIVIIVVVIAVVIVIVVVIVAVVVVVVERGGIRGSKNKWSPPMRRRGIRKSKSC